MSAARRGARDARDNAVARYSFTRKNVRLETSMKTFEKEVKPMLQKGVSDLWASPNYGNRLISSGSFMRLYTQIWQFCEAQTTGPVSDRTSRALTLAYNAVTTSAIVAVKYTLKELLWFVDDIAFVRTAGSIYPECERRLKLVLYCFHRHSRSFGKNETLFRMEWNNPEAFQKLCNDAQTLGLQNDVHRRMDRVLWDVHIGGHSNWKPDGPEWRNIGKYYGSIGQIRSVTTMRLREIWVYTRPVDASIQPRRVIDPAQRSMGVTSDMRNDHDNDKMDSADSPGPSGSWIPDSGRHWCLAIVQDGEIQLIRELNVVDGQNIVNKVPDDNFLRSRGRLVGYTTLTDKEIGNRGNEALRYLGGQYGVLSHNCQCYATILNEIIRVPTSITDICGGLSHIPAHLVPQVARYRSEEFMTTYFVQLSKAQVPRSLPIPIGTLAHGLLVPASVALVLHSLVYAHICHFVLHLLVVGFFLHNQKGTVSIYMQPSLKLAAQEAFYFAYLMKYGDMNDEFVRKFIAKRRLSEKDLILINLRLAEIADNSSRSSMRGLKTTTKKKLDFATAEKTIDGLLICDVD